jgi:hypothetical protein
MKTFLISGILLFMATAVVAQQSKFVTYNSAMKILARNNGEAVEWENTNISVNFDYRTGEFITYLTNTDFANPNADADNTGDDEVQRRQLTLEGTFPINDIINQQQATQNYKVELQLRADDLNLSETILFDMTIMQPETGEGKSSRFFKLSGILYNEETNLPAFIGYDNDIQIWLLFNGFMNVQ